ncbi:MAG TPA: hypothetical protein VF784_00685 [Anaerolineales bacterium]
MHHDDRVLGNPNRFGGTHEDANLAQPGYRAGGYYKYHWWGLNNPDGTYDYLAWGKQGQYLYVSPSTNTVVVRLGGGTQYYPWPFAIRALIRSLP